MDHGGAASITWWQSGLLGLGAGLPVVWAVCAFAADLSSAGGLGGIVVFLAFGPMIVVALAVAGSVVAWAVGKGQGPWWVVAAPMVMWPVLLIGTLTSGPSGSLPELRAGWSLVVLVMYGAAGAVFARRPPRRVRVLATVVLVAAAPLMIAYDDASQDRWRRATYASAPRVLPVIAGYAVVAARSDGRELTVVMRGSVDVWVSVLRCRDCTVRRESAVNGMTVVDGAFELWIPPVDGPAGQRLVLDDIRLRPAGIDELMALPVAAMRTSS
jgi:hypothetical protein